jgi:hypothetical protein
LHLKLHPGKNKTELILPGQSKKEARRKPQILKSEATLKPHERLTYGFFFAQKAKNQSLRAPRPLECLRKRGCNQY